MQSKRPPKVPSVVHGETLGQRIHGSRREIRVIVIPEGLGIMAVQTQLHADIARNEQKQTTR